MLVRAVLGVALVATGCFSPHFDDCKVTCSSGNGCPGDYECVSGVCRLGGMTGPCVLPMDDSNTTQNDATDADTGIADEDLDGLADDVDPCPISANNTDSDSDGVGDNCEPAANGNDKILLFEGFHGNVAPPTANIMGSWTFSGGKAHIVSGAGTASAITFAITSSTSIRDIVMARVTVDGQFSTPSDPTGAGPVSSTNTGGTEGIACEIGRDPAFGTDAQMLVKIASAADAKFNSNAAIASPGTGTILQLTRNPNDIYNCYQQGSAVAQLPPTPLPTSRRGGIRTRSMSATFEWVMILSSQ